MGYNCSRFVSSKRNEFLHCCFRTVYGANEATVGPNRPVLFDKIPYYTLPTCFRYEISKMNYYDRGPFFLHVHVPKTEHTVFTNKTLVTVQMSIVS